MSGAQEGAGRVRNLGTELGEARAESRRGRTLSGLIAEGGLSHGVHVRAHREERERRGNQRAGRESSPAGGAAARVGHWTPLFLSKASDILYHTLARGDPDLKTARVRAPGLFLKI